MTPIEIFMLGWHECLKQLEDLTGHDYYAPGDLPSPDAIMELIRAAQPQPKGPPYDVADMKEYPVG